MAQHLVKIFTVNIIIIIVWLSQTLIIKRDMLESHGFNVGFSEFVRSNFGTPIDIDTESQPLKKHLRRR